MINRTDIREEPVHNIDRNIKGDPEIYLLLEKSGLFPKEPLPGYDCVARAMTAALYLYEVGGELSEIHNLKMDKGEVAAPDAPDLLFQTYLIHKEMPYCYPVTWHKPIFPELTSDTIKQRSKFGEISGVMIGSMWHSMTGDKQIIKLFDKYHPKSLYALRKVLGRIVYRGNISGRSMEESYKESLLDVVIIKMRRNFPELLTPKPKSKVPLLENVMGYVFDAAKRDGWGRVGLDELRALIANHTINYCEEVNND